MLKLSLIFLGSGLGGVLRYGVGEVVKSWWGVGGVGGVGGPAFPLGTMIVNISGCLVMGFLAAAWHGPVFVREEVRTGVLIGILGGYTTFSSFSRDALVLAERGDWAKASGYVLGSVALSLLGVWIGAAIAGKAYGAGAP